MKYLVLFLLWQSATIPALMVLSAGKKCAKENCILERKESQFYYRGNTWPGLVCPTHNALYEDPAKPFMASIIRN